MFRFDDMEKFFDEHEEELKELGITSGVAVDYSVLIIAINFHRRLKKIEEKIGNEN